MLARSNHKEGDKEIVRFDFLGMYKDANKKETSLI